MHACTRPRTNAKELSPWNKVLRDMAWSVRAGHPSVSSISKALKLWMGVPAL
jgi:hypothetical protein